MPPCSGTRLQSNLETACFAAPAANETLRIIERLQEEADKRKKAREPKPVTLRRFSWEKEQ